MLTFVGKLNRGMSVVDTVEILKGSELSEAEYLQAAILGWGIELVCERRRNGNFSSPTDSIAPTSCKHTFSLPTI